MKTPQRHPSEGFKLKAEWQTRTRTPAWDALWRRILDEIVLERIRLQAPSNMVDAPAAEGINDS